MSRSRLRAASIPALFTLVPSLALASPSSSNLRSSAQRGLDFLGKDTAAWQTNNRCYGCHVQAVTLEGLAVGKHHQYRVAQASMKEVLRGLLDLPGGAHTKEGLSHPGFPRTAKTFGASAFARYDAYVDQAVTRDLLVLAKELMAFQQQDGSVVGDHVGPPVTTGVMQATYQAAQTWRQAYARTADDMWRAPLRHAEQYIATTARKWEGNPKGVYLQDINYAVLGLVAAGVSPTESDLARLIKYLEKQQLQDGGWGFDGRNSDAFATGQTVHALRMAGRAEQDRVVGRGLSWLVAHQKQDGGWGGGGRGRAEAMWAVMGLVSVDVLSVAMSGIGDGEHVLPAHDLVIEAKDNQGQEVEGIELRVDDLPVATVKGNRLAFHWDTQKLAAGLHTVDAIAKNAKGEKSTRRMEVYAGDVFLTQLGSRFDGGATQLTLRNIAPTGTRGAVTMTVFPDEGSEAERAKPVATVKQDTTAGPMSFSWDGAGPDKKPARAGRYRAEIAFVDDKGKVRQKETSVFVHDTLEAQQQRYAQIEGSLDLARAGGGKAANAEVELVDDRGQVVQSTRSNEAGQYRFKSVSGGNYKVRFKKDGFKAMEADVAARPAAPAASVNAAFH